MKKLSEQFNSISVQKGEEFVVELQGNPSTGYLWELEVKSGQATVVGRETIPHSTDPMVIGGGATERTVMRAEETGSIEIEANLRRPWAKNDAPAQSQQFKVKVL